MKRWRNRRPPGRGDRVLGLLSHGQRKVGLCTTWLADATAPTAKAFRVNIWAPAEYFVLRSGNPKSYVKTAESGNKRGHAFCGDCGTPIRRSMPVRWTIPRPMLCASVPSPSVRPSHRGGKAGGVLRCTGSTRSPPCRRPKEGDALSADENRFRRGPTSAAPTRPACGSPRPLPGHVPRKNGRRAVTPGTRPA